ncbi:MAG: hypothetical protein V1725_03170 [archaeon]
MRLLLSGDKMRRLSNAAIGIIGLGTAALLYLGIRGCHSWNESGDGTVRYEGQFRNYHVRYVESIGHLGNTNMMTLVDQTNAAALRKIIIFDEKGERISDANSLDNYVIDEVDITLDDKTLLLTKDNITKKTYSLEEEQERIFTDSLWQRTEALYVAGRAHVLAVEKGEIAPDQFSLLALDSGLVQGPPYDSLAVSPCTDE